MESQYKTFLYRDHSLGIIVSNLYAFYYLSCIITLTGDSSTMLNNNGESGHLWLVPNTKGKAVILSPLSMMLGFVVVVDALYQVEEVPFYSWFAESFSYEWMVNFI